MIHISGSIAYDRIMTFPGKFEEHILPEKLHTLNVSFMVNSVVEKRGGTAGNIAYSLALLNEKPMVYSCVGKDFTAYGKAFEALGISLEGISVVEDEFTASCYITTDLTSNQIAAFSPAAMGHKLESTHFPKVDPQTDWAILSPGNLDDMISLSRYYAKNKVRTICDPGQQIVVIPHEDLCEMIYHSEILIGNDYEITTICKNMNLTIEELSEKVPYIIITYGEKGSSIVSKSFDEPHIIAPVTANKVLDPTGCGDAYRAGLLKGLCDGLDVTKAAKLASVVASYCVEENGTQEHTFTAENLQERYLKTYSE